MTRRRSLTCSGSARTSNASRGLVWGSPSSARISNPPLWVASSSPTWNPRDTPRRSSARWRHANSRFVGVYLEGTDPVEGNRKLTESTEPFGLWFKSQLKTIFPPEIDFDKPVPPVKEIFDSETLPASS